MKIGDKITVKSAIIGDSLFWHKKDDRHDIHKIKKGRHEDGYANSFTGTVVYIHPKRRYFTVRYDFKRGSFYESFKCKG